MSWYSDIVPSTVQIGYFCFFGSGLCATHRPMIPKLWNNCVFVVYLLFNLMLSALEGLVQEQQNNSETHHRWNILSKCRHGFQSSGTFSHCSATPSSTEPATPSPWAACYSLYALPNSHNGGQGHLLLLEGVEVCIRLQLRRKTSRCL